MTLRPHKFVRSGDLSSDLSSTEKFSTEDGLYHRKTGKTVHSVLKSIQGGFEIGSESDKPDEEFGSRKKILDTQGPFLQKWNKICVLSCVIALSLDPLFFYIPVINGKKKCLGVDKSLAITACVLRSFTDIFYVLHIIFQFHTRFIIRPSSQVFGRAILLKDQMAMKKRYLPSYFIIDILSVLPFPQVVVLVTISKLKDPVSLVMKASLKFIILSQYVPRLIRIYPLHREATRTSGILTEMAWAGATFFLLLYMLASHVVGAFWYLFSIERRYRCWWDACRELKCDYKHLYCGEHHIGDNVFLNASCPLVEPDIVKNPMVFNFGIFLDALQSGVVESRDFPEKFFYCFWWGIRNLSSLGQNLKTSTFVGEILFAVFILIFGMVLYSLLISNMHKYLLSTTASVDRKIDEMRVRQDVELWMSQHMLPQNLRERIRQYKQCKWQQTRAVEDTLIPNLSKDLRKDIKRHLYLALLMRVPFFENMNKNVLDTLCDRLQPVLYLEGSFIALEGDPVDEMLFIRQGTLLSGTTNNGKINFLNSVYLKANDFCGEELIPWALDPNSSPHILPTSTRTIEALTEVEAFALMADDLKSVIFQFRRFHGKKFRHTFRFYSKQWRVWAACFIQASWRRYWKRKLEMSLREEDDRLSDAFATETSPSLGATIYASKFAAHLLQKSRHNNAKHNAKVRQRFLPVMPKKPAEPDFTVEDH